MEGELSPLAEDPPRVKFKVERRRVGPTTLGCFGGAGGLVTQFCLSLAPWTVARQAPLSMGFSRQEYASGLPFSPLGHPPEPGIKIESPTWEAPDVLTFAQLVLNIPF